MEKLLLFKETVNGKTIYRGCVAKVSDNQTIIELAIKNLNNRPLNPKLTSIKTKRNEIICGRFSVYVWLDVTFSEYEKQYILSSMCEYLKDLYCFTPRPFGQGFNNLILKTLIDCADAH